MNIRRATVADLEVIREIYNDAILHTTATFDTEIKPMEYFIKWLEMHNENYPAIVAEIEYKIIGYASLSQYSDRCAYSQTAENSLYLKSDYRGKGLGKKLLQQLIEEGRKANLHTILARITSGNDVSVYLHQQQGFNVIGVMKEVGVKFGKLLDVTLMQYIYKRSAD